MTQNLLTCIAGVAFLIIISFIASFAGNFRLAWKGRKRLRKIRKKYRLRQDEVRKAGLKIPGYYEELLNRGKTEETFNNSRPTII